MSNQSQEQLSTNLHSKVDKYIERTGDVITIEDREAFVSMILEGRNVDLSGVTAVRGFIYQYYIAAKYIVEMLFSEKSWWDKVMIEILDDVALVGQEQIRFIQAKTKRESDIDNHMNLNELYKRKKGKGSWLDKLFLLNLYIADSEQKTLKLENNFLENYTFQFELATNSTYHEDIAVYEKNDNFESNSKKEEYQKLKDAISKGNLEWEVVYGDETFKITENNYNNEIKNIDWYLQNFRVKRHGDILYLRKEIVDKIKSHTDGNMDQFHTYKSELILDMLLLEIIKKTCQDSDSTPFIDFVFDKETLIIKFDGWTETAELNASESATNNLYHKKFTSCFEIIKQDIENGNWKPHLKKELLETSEAFEKNLSDSVRTQIDSFAYQRIVNRIFNLNNFSSKVHINEVDTSRIVTALRTYIYCLVFYGEAQYSSLDSILSFKKGIDINQNESVFSVYNARRSTDLEWAKKLVRTAAVKCAVSESYNHDFYCFVADVKNIKKKNNKRPKEEDSIHASVTDAVKGDGVILGMEDVVSEKDITKIVENIKFRKISIVEDHFDYLQENENQPEHSFKEENIKSEWDLELKKSD
ncbi:DUF4297 domain-containing protein (plasmid) [Planococcus maritimus]|uniref:hypothetical protein n=1 Tax=Planococcus maritimus TaxID=192421 RepID=UPI003138977C